MEIIQRMDVAILLWIQENLRAEIFTPFWKIVTALGNGGWFWIVLGLGFLCFKRTRKTGITLLIALVIGALITNVALKNLVARVRPYDYTEAIRSLLPPQSDFSFPSGHTCASFAAAFVCLKRLPRAWGVAAMGLAGLIAFSRLYLGVHFPTDILGGLVIGLAAGWLACRLQRMKNR